MTRLGNAIVVCALVALIYYAYINRETLINIAYWALSLFFLV